ncbi:MAG: ABC-type transport auxiliary lipoprotein family protein [Pseudomonadota bacterium]
MNRLAALFLLALPACSLLGGGEVLDIYELRAPEGLPTANGPAPREVVVELPEAAGTLETDRILVRPDALAAQYLPGARWGEETPVMVQTLMLRSLQATEGLTYVGRRPLGSGGDFAIVSDILDFQAETEGDTARVVITLEVRIVRERDAAIAAGRTFQAEASAASSATDDLIAAFDTASDALFSEFAIWTMARLGRPI